MTKLDSLRQALPNASLRESPPHALEGHRFELTFAPADGDELALALKLLGELDVASIVCGGGTRLGLGNPPREAPLCLSTQSLDAILELDADEGVVHAQAGTPLVALRAAVRDAGWELPLDPPGQHTTLGGCLASAAVGPRVTGFGRTRDAVLGLRVVLASGERTHWGGRVVKNVTGYDLGKLYVGSLGSLGVIESAWLRLRPLPEASATWAARISADAAGLERALAAARRSSVRVACLLDAKTAAGIGLPAPGQAEFVLLVELAGAAPVVEADGRQLAETLTAESVDADCVSGLRDWQGALPFPAGMRFRLAALPTRLPSLLQSLQKLGAELAVHPVQALVYARFALEEGDAAHATELDAAVRDGTHHAEAVCLLEDAPRFAKSDRDVFGNAGATLELFQALKQRFDPKAVLNPGRFAGML